jgi:hypothetical protein
MIRCPKCPIPIRNSTRYIKLLNERARQIDKVKEKLLGNKPKEQLLAEWDILMKALKEKEMLLPSAVEFTEIWVGENTFFFRKFYTIFFVCGKKNYYTNLSYYEIFHKYDTNLKKRGFHLIRSKLTRSRTSFSFKFLF